MAPHAISTRITLSILATTLLAATLGALGPNLPKAQAAAATHPTVVLVNTTAGTATPHGGTVADLSGSGTDTFAVTASGLSCPAASAQQFGGPVEAVAFITPTVLTDYPNAISPSTGSTITVDELGAYSAGWGNDGAVDEATGAITAGDTTLFPGAPGWQSFSGRYSHDQGAWDAIGQTAGSYSLGIACVEGALPNRNEQVDIDPTTNHPLVAWSTLVVNADGSFSVPSATATSLVATADASTPTTANLTATVAPATAGTVNFYDGTSATPLNSAPVAVASGAATFAATGLTSGSHSFTATFTPTDGGFAPSTSSPVTLTIGTVKTATTVALVGTATGTQIVLSATVRKPDGSTATDAQGTVEFDETAGGTLADKGKAVVNGVATDTVTGLTPGSSYTFTATYTADGKEAYASSTASPPAPVLVPAAGQNGTLSNGGVVVPGSTYDVLFPTGTFTNSGSVQVVLHSAPQTLSPGTAAADGSLSYSFTAPTTLDPGSAHTLVFTDATNTAAVAQTVAFTVQATATSGTTPSGSNPSNSPVGFATDWIRAMAKTPAGISGLFGMSILFAGALTAGWFWFWRSRRRLAVNLVPTPEVDNS